MTKLDTSLPPSTYSSTSTGPSISTGFRHDAAQTVRQTHAEAGVTSLFTSLMNALVPPGTPGFGTAPDHGKTPAPDGSSMEEQVESGDSAARTTTTPVPAAHQPVAVTVKGPVQAQPDRGGDWTTQAVPVPTPHSPRPASAEPVAPAAGNQISMRPARDTESMPQLPARNETTTNTPARLQPSFEVLLPASSKAQDQRSANSALNVTMTSQNQPAVGSAEQRPDAVQMGSRPPASAEWAPVKVNTQHAQWSRDLAAALGDRLNMQVNQNIKEASVRLDPPDLGRIELTVRLDGDRLNIQLNASNTHVRDMLSQHADRLRSDLMAQNTQTVDVQVGQQQHRGGSGQPQTEREIIAAALLRDEGEPDTDNPEQPSDRWLSTSA